MKTRIIISDFKPYPKESRDPKFRVIATEQLTDINIKGLYAVLNESIFLYVFPNNFTLTAFNKRKFSSHIKTMIHLLQKDRLNNNREGIIVEQQIEQIKQSYDKAIEYGSKGIDLYKELPKYIIDDPDYPAYQRLAENNTLSDSGRKEIGAYLNPTANQSFVDLGCCLNLMFRGYKEWPSTYYGVDISSKTIQLLQHFAESEHLTVGALHCGSIHETPFVDNQFDIGACIGVLEYFDQPFVESALKEIHRIMRPNTKLVLDVPDIGSPENRIAMMIEEHLGRPDKYDLSTEEFEGLLCGKFEIVSKEKVGPMIQYFLRVTS